MHKAYKIEGSRSVHPREKMDVWINLSTEKNFNYFWSKEKRATICP